MANSDDDVQFGAVANKALPALVSAAALAVVGASISTWVSVRIIQGEVANLVQSDRSQDVRIEKLNSDVNDIRVRIGVIRTLLDLKGAPE